MDVQELERVMDQCLVEADRDGKDRLEALTDCIDRYLQGVAKNLTWDGQIIGVYGAPWLEN